MGAIHLNSKYLARLTAAVLIAAAASSAHAGVRAGSYAYANGAVLAGSNQASGPSGSVSSNLATTYSFSGTDPTYEAHTYDWTVTSQASSTVGVVKFGVTSTVTNPFATSFSDNVPYVTQDPVDPEVFYVNPDGTPSEVSIQAFAIFSDVFTVGGDAAFVQFALHLDGEVQSDFASYARALVYGSDLLDAYQSESVYSYGGGSTDVTILSKYLPVVDHHVTFGLNAEALVFQFLDRTGNFGDFSSINASVNFLNTLAFSSVQGYGADMTTPTVITSLSGADNTSFNTLQGVTSSAPEPSTWALSICGFALAGASLRQRRRVAHARKAGTRTIFRPGVSGTMSKGCVS